MPNLNFSVSGALFRGSAALLPTALLLVLSISERAIAQPASHQAPQPAKPPASANGAAAPPPPSAAPAAEVAAGNVGSGQPPALKSGEEAPSVQAPGAGSPNASGEAKPKSLAAAPEPTQVESPGGNKSVLPKKRSVATSKKKPGHAAAEPAPAAPLSPLSPAVSVGIVIDNTWNRDGAYDFFSEDDLATRGGVFAAWDALAFSSLILAVGVELAGGSSSDVGPFAADASGFSPAPVTRSEIEHTDLGGSLGLRYGLLPWVSPHVRVAGGASLVSTKIDGFGTSVKRDQTQPYVSAGVGLTLQSANHRVHKTRRRFNSIAVMGVVEGGFLASGAIDFELPEQQPTDPDADTPQEIRVLATPLGRLQRSGPYLRVGLLAYF
jgi:hypothetical protein